MGILQVGFCSALVCHINLMRLDSKYYICIYIMTDNYNTIMCDNFLAKNYTPTGVIKDLGNPVEVKPRGKDLDPGYNEVNGLKECQYCFDFVDKLFWHDTTSDMMCQECVDKTNGELNEIYCKSSITIGDKSGVYYCLYGGGPEGGLFVSNGKAYDIERNWGTEFKIIRQYKSCFWEVVDLGESNPYLRITN
jgi:hypothetical protein